MPRDMRGTGRYPPQPRFPPFAFYSAVRLGDPELLAKIMAVDPYYITQLDMAHHLLNNGALVNQRDASAAGWTPLHRAAALAHVDGYLELYEYLLSRGADPSLLTHDDSSYLNPGPKSVMDVAVEDGGVREALRQLNDKYKDVPKAPLAHPDAGDWWALYDYGPGVVAAWPHDYTHPYPEVQKRRRDKAAARAAKQQQRAAAAAALEHLRAENFTVPFTLKTMAALPGLATAPAAALPGATQTPPAPPTTARSASASASASASSAPLSSSAAAAPPAGPPTVLLFPGQGSQAVGRMVSESTASRLPAVRSMLEEARRELGYDVLTLVKEGPQERLDDTSVAQPVLFIANLAALEVLRADSPDLAARFSAAAGLSLGEYSALVAAGAMSFRDGLKVVKARGAAMAAAAAAGGRPHGMLSVVGLSDEQLSQLCEEAIRARGSGTVCQVANYLFPQGRVVSGHADALDLVAAGAGQLGALKAARLAVAGAFHTSLMEPAREALMKVLASVELRAPRVPVLSNVTAAPFPDDPEAIRQLLGRQLVEPVRWEATLNALLSGDSGSGIILGLQAPVAPAVGAAAAAAAHSPRPVAAAAGAAAARLVEVGPGTQIKAMVRRLSTPAWKAFVNVSAA